MKNYAVRRNFRLGFKRLSFLEDYLYVVLFSGGGFTSASGGLYPPSPSAIDVLIISYLCEISLKT